MKSIYPIYRSYFLLVFLILAGNSAFAQNAKAQKKLEKIAAIKKLIDQKNYIFMAQRANPLGWTTINLNYNYSLTVTQDSVDSYLPYYGRAYVAPINPTDPKQTGIQFISKNFDYQNQPAKNKNWNITISPRDNNETRTMFLNISETGYATLSVTSTNRQQISFDGYISEVPKKKS